MNATIRFAWRFLLCPSGLAAGLIAAVLFFVESVIRLPNDPTAWLSIAGNILVMAVLINKLRSLRRRRRRLKL